MNTTPTPTLTYGTTERGFPLVEFTDIGNAACSLQKSSRAFVPAVWLGLDDVTPRSMIPQGQPGAHPWQDYPLPEHVHIFSRMELTQAHVRELLPLLQYFAEHGELPTAAEESACSTKSKNRVNKAYKEGTPEWDAEYNMLLDDGVACAECRHIRRCATIFGQNEKDTSCQFHPNRFKKEESACSTNTPKPILLGLCGQCDAMYDVSNCLCNGLILPCGHPWRHAVSSGLHVSESLELSSKASDAMLCDECADALGLAE